MIVTKQKIKKICDELRSLGKKIVTTNGSFDLLHAGHLKSLEIAKTYGDVLIIGLNSDKSVKAYKNPLRPIIDEMNRAKMLDALSVVNYVVIFDELDPIDFLSYVKPDFHVKSKEGFKGIETSIVEKNGGQIILIDDIPGLSTTEIIKKIIEINNLEK